MLIPKFIEENKRTRIVEKTPPKKNGELTMHKKLELSNSMLIKQENKWWIKYKNPASKPKYEDIVDKASSSY